MGAGKARDARIGDPAPARYTVQLSPSPEFPA